MPNHNTNTEIWHIDNLGNLYQGSDAVGTYDSITKKCELYDGTEVPCPNANPIVNQPTVQSKQTYWWVLLLAFCIAVVLLAWWINRKK